MYHIKSLSTIQSYVHHRIPQSTSFSIVQTSYLNIPQFTVMYTIAFLKVRAFQLSKRHISTIHNLELCTPSHSSKYELFNCSNVISQQSTIQSYVHHRIPQSTSFSIVQTSYLNNPQFTVMYTIAFLKVLAFQLSKRHISTIHNLVMYTIAFLKVRAFPLSKRHISTIHNLELCTPSHSSKYELFNCPNVISQQSTIQSYVHHRIPQSTSFSIVQTSYLNNPQFRVMYTIAFLKVRAFQLSKRHISTIHNLELCTPSHSSKYELFNCPNVISQQYTIQSYVHHRIPQSTSFSIVQTSYLNNPQFRVMYTIAFLKVRAFQLSKRHISTIHNLELCTPSHSSKYELFNCPNVISQQSTIQSYVHHRIPQSTSFSIVQTSYLNNPQFRVMYTIAFLKVRAFQLSKRHISTIHNLELCTPSHSSKYELFNCPNVISQQSTIQSYVHHRIPQSTSFSIVQTSYLNNPQFRVMYTIAFLKVRAFQLSKRHISTIHNLELCTPSHYSKHELFNCPNVISQQSTIQSYVHHRIPQSTSFSIVQTSYLNNSQFRVMYTIAFLKVRAFQLSKRHISTIHNLELCTPSHSSKYELFNCPNVISQQSTIQSYVHHRIPQSTSFSIVQTSYLNNPQFRVMYTIAFLKVRAFQLSKRHISTIHNLELCTPSHSSKYELFNCPNVISQQSTIQSYVHHRIPQSTSFSIVQTSYLNNPQFRVMYTIAFLKVRAFQLSKRHISTIHNLELCTPSHSSKYELFNCPNVISQQSTIQSYVHHRIPQSTSFSIVQTSYLNNPQFRVMYTIAFLKVRAFQLSKRHISTIHNLELCTPSHSSKYELFNCPNVISQQSTIQSYVHHRIPQSTSFSIVQTSYLNNSQFRVMYTIAFLKVRAFQLSKRHISTIHNLELCTPSHSSKYELFNCPNVISQQSTIQSYVHHRIPQSTSFSIVQTSYLNNPQFRVMYTIAFLKVRAFQLSKRHISTIHNLELCTPSHSSKYELFNCPNVISQQSTIQSYVQTSPSHRIPQSTSFSIVQTSYLNNPQFRVMYTIAFLKVRAFQLSKRHISTIHNLELCTPSHSSKYELFNCPNVISQQSTIQSYVHHRIPQSTSFSIVQTSYLNNPQFRVMYTIAFLKVRAFQLSKRHISTIHNLELCTPSHSSKYELFNCPNVISQQSTIQSYVHHRIPQSTSFSIVQTSYLNNPQFRVMYTIAFLKVRAFQLSKRHISTIHNLELCTPSHSSKYELFNCPNVISQQSTIQSYVHHRIPQSTSFSIVQTSYLNNTQFRVMYTIAFLKVRAFQLSKRHISTIHNLELCTPSHSSKYELFNCPNVISQQYTIQSYVHHRIPQSTSFSIVQTSYLNNQFRVMYTIAFLKVFNCPNVISQQSTIQSYVHHRIPQSTSFSIVQTSYLNNTQFRVMYTIAFLKVRAFQLSKRHISTIHNLELCTPSHSSKYELFNCPNVISQQSTIQSYVHHRIPQSTSFSIVQTSYLNNPQFRVMYTIAFLKVRAFQLSKRHISTIHNLELCTPSHSSKYELFKCPNVISLLAKLPEWWH